MDFYQITFFLIGLLTGFFTNEYGTKAGVIGLIAFAIALFAYYLDK